MKAVCHVLVLAVTLVLGLAHRLSAEPPAEGLSYTSTIGSGLGGKEFKAPVPKDCRLVSIQVNVGKKFFGDVVKGLKFVYEDRTGKRNEIPAGPCDGMWQKGFEVPKGAQLVGITGSYGLVIDSIRFHFSDGTRSPRFGGPGGDLEFGLAVKKRDGVHQKTVRGIWGRAGEDNLTALGLILQ